MKNDKKDSHLNSKINYYPVLQQIVNPSTEQKIASVPLQFQYIPVEILSKEFTKFNNPHEYRIHYLGPRPINSFVLHKKYGTNQYETTQYNKIQCSKDHGKYQVNLRKIVQSNFMNEGLQNNHHYRTAIFYRAFQGMNPTLNLKDQIQFNSCFQSGNLDCVIKICQNQFDLFLRIDSNTRGHTQWYYFSVKNGKKKQRIKLNICNITKGKTLYENGMKPYIFSRKRFQQNKQEWIQGGENTIFQEKNLRFDLIYQKIKVPTLYRLSFQYQFDFDDDQVFFAYSIPYTYSQLLYDINKLPDKYVKKSVLGKSLTGVNIQILHITNHSCDSIESLKTKKSILITGRVHPGQSNSSHMLNGFLNYLISQSQQAKELRKRVNFYVIPMVNPDGVIMGNSRSSAAGKDLNRQYRTLRSQLYPQVSLIKAFCYRVQKNFGLMMYFDFHGHSRKKNTFFYGPPYVLSDQQYYKCRILPRLIQKLNSSFRYYGCSYNISEQKRKTARAVLFQQIKIPYTFTIQSSIGMYYNFDTKTTNLFEQKAWKSMGQNICQGLSQFIVLQEQYQQMIKQRIQARAKIKQIKSSKINLKLDTKFLEDQGQDPQQNEKTSSSQKFLKGSIFSALLQQVKQNGTKNNFNEQQVSSDDHDENQNLQASKLNQFNNLIVQNAKNQLQFAKYKSIEQDQLQQINLTKDSLLNNDCDKQKSISPQKRFKIGKINNKVQTIKSQKSKQDKKNHNFKQQEKQKNIFAQRNVQKSQNMHKNSKNFVLANKQRYSLATKNFLTSTETNNKYQIISLPKNIQLMRKQMKKGRGLINNLLQSKLKNFEKQFGEQYHANNLPQFSPQKINRYVQNGDHIFKSAKLFLQSPQKQSSIRPQSQRRSSTSYLKRRQFLQSQNGLRGIKKRQKEQEQIISFQDIQLDNMAMTIRTFKCLK